MNVLVIGGGGREHALVWALRRAPSVQTLYAAPGNPGIAQSAECVPLKATDMDGLAAFAADHRVDLTIVGPEAPLAAGLVDRFTALGLRAFGPSRAAAEIETSKAFAKALMKTTGIPTADYQSFTSPDEATAYVRRHGAPVVVKADGLAAGKGVVVCRQVDDAIRTIQQMMVEQVFGAAGTRIVVEDYLAGEEASVLALTDGETVIPLIPSQDHKQVFDGDRGPNTGGMGAYAPVPVVDERCLDEIMARILVPAVRAMAAQGRPYRGVLYAGLMLTADGPKVIEFNCRFGDPETQVIVPLLKNDLADIAVAVCEGDLSRVSLDWHSSAAVCVVLASGGYPGKYETSKPISGLDRLAGLDDVIVFHADTALKDGQVVTDGGRVVGVTALGRDIRAAISRAYEAVDQVAFEGKYFRRDIGQKALARVS
ncbi:MAG: phosphoribosylamine--glycine ligase [Candidatus Latescibacteria bacterium]|nr:phosphoribosylamine--glycine ligase [Candidatus Latescibacterota bacterium]